MPTKFGVPENEAKLISTFAPAPILRKPNGGMDVPAGNAKAPVFVEPV